MVKQKSAEDAAFAKEVNRGNRDGYAKYNSNVDLTLTVVGTESDIFNTAAASTLSELGKGAKGVATVSKIATGAGIVGGVATLATAAYEYKTHKANTHTIVDIGVASVGILATVAGTIIASLAIVVGAAAGGLVWGIVSFAGGSDAIDKLSNDWGKKLIYVDK